MGYGAKILNSYSNLHLITVFGHVTKPHLFLTHELLTTRWGGCSESDTSEATKCSSCFHREVLELRVWLGHITLLGARILVKKASPFPPTPCKSGMGHTEFQVSQVRLWSKLNQKGRFNNLLVSAVETSLDNTWRYLWRTAGRILWASS